MTLLHMTASVVILGLESSFILPKFWMDFSSQAKQSADQTYGLHNILGENILFP